MFDVTKGQEQEIKFSHDHFCNKNYKRVKIGKNMWLMDGKVAETPPPRASPQFFSDPTDEEKKVDVDALAARWAALA
jgi:hypothetical protein